MENSFNPEQMLMIQQMLNKANFDLNRKENLSANIARVSEQEVWKGLKEIEGFEEYSEYEISNFGNVKSLKFGKEKILKPGVDVGGYLQVGLYSNKMGKTFLIHRMVAAAFVENTNPEVKIQVNHVNHDKKDNYYHNLEYVSNAENQMAFNEYDEEKVALKKQKISETKTGTWSGSNNPMFGSCRTGDKNPMFGKRHSEESKRKISETRKATNQAKKLINKNNGENNGK